MAQDDVHLVKLLSALPPAPERSCLPCEPALFPVICVQAAMVNARAFCTRRGDTLSHWFCIVWPWSSNRDECSKPWNLLSAPSTERAGLAIGTMAAGRELLPTSASLLGPSLSLRCSGTGLSVDVGRVVRIYDDDFLWAAGLGRKHSEVRTRKPS